MVSKVLIVGPEDHGPPSSPQKAWRVVGWFGLLLVLVGVAEISRPWLDPELSTSRDYERIAASLGALAIPSLGMGLWVASALVRGHRTLLLATGLAALLLAALILGSYAYFLSVVPAGVRGVSLVAAAEVKAILLRATLVAIGSALALMGAGVTALLHARRSHPG